MWCAVMPGLIAWILVTGWRMDTFGRAFTFPAGAFALTPGFFPRGWGSAMLIATYDYWGYYNITFLGGEVKDAALFVPQEADPDPRLRWLRRCTWR